MDELTERNLRALEGHVIARVAIGDDDAVDLGVADSEGWRLVVAARRDHAGDPLLVARWKPGLPHQRPLGRPLHNLARRVQHAVSRV